MQRIWAEKCTNLSLRIHGAIYRLNSFVSMLHYCVNLKAIGYESTGLNRVVVDKSNRVVIALTLFDMGFFGTFSHRNFVVITPMIMKFGTGVKLDVFYTMVTIKLVTSLLLRHYDVITCIFDDA